MRKQQPAIYVVIALPRSARWQYYPALQVQLAVPLHTNKIISHKDLIN